MSLGGTEALLRMQEETLAEHIKTQEDLRIALLIRAVVTETVKEHALTAEEKEWVRLAIRREARIEKFRNAVIEKTLPVLVLGALTFVGYALWEYVKLKLGIKQP